MTPTEQALRNEIQAYLDAHNINNHNPGQPGWNSPPMAHDLMLQDGVWFYMYDGIVQTGIKPRPNGTVTIYYDCNNETLGNHPDHSTHEQESLAEHFRTLHEHTLNELITGGYLKGRIR